MALSASRHRQHKNQWIFLLAATGDLDATKRFFGRILKDEPLVSPTKIGTDGASTFPPAMQLCNTPSRPLLPVIDHGVHILGYVGLARAG